MLSGTSQLPSIMVKHGNFCVAFSDRKCGDKGCKIETLKNDKFVTTYSHKQI